MTTSQVPMPGRTYRINVPDSAIDRLKQKLEVATFPDELEAQDQWPYGAPLADVKRLATYWKDEFDWRKEEENINTLLPQYMTTITPEGFDPLDIHYVYRPSDVKNAIPLLFCHGWPGSFLEVSKLLPLLRHPTEPGPPTNMPGFHVVAPSLPNFGFSSGVKKPGFTLEKYAEVCHKLMLQLGYTEYVTQGGDWGFYVTRALGRLYPESVKASHVNMVRAFPPEFKKNPWQKVMHSIMPYSEREKKGLERSKWFDKEGSGYNLEQRTKPQTIGYALADSPVALLAWIYEKLHDWTDSYPWTPDEILTWISIYQFSTAGPAASVRIYYEATHTPPPSSTRSWTPRLGKREELSLYTPTVKLGLAYFPKELTVVPRTWGRTLGPVVYESEHDVGGHFAAWEHPEVVAGDLQAMFGRGGAAFGCVKGRTGFDRARL